MKRYLVMMPVGLFALAMVIIGCHAKGRAVNSAEASTLPATVRAAIPTDQAVTVLNRVRGLCSESRSLKPLAASEVKVENGQVQLSAETEEAFEGHYDKTRPGAMVTLHGQLTIRFHKPYAHFVDCWPLTPDGFYGQGSWFNVKGTDYQFDVHTLTKVESAHAELVALLKKEAQKEGLSLIRTNPPGP